MITLLYTYVVEEYFKLLRMDVELKNTDLSLVSYNYSAICMQQKNHYCYQKHFTNAYNYKIALIFLMNFVTINAIKC